MVPWIMGERVSELETEKNFPNYFAWNKRLMERPAVKKVLKDRQDAMGGGH
jgi:glutathione S-transferase